MIAAVAMFAPKPPALPNWPSKQQCDLTHTMSPGYITSEVAGEANDRCGDGKEDEWNGFEVIGGRAQSFHPQRVDLNGINWCEHA